MDDIQRYLREHALTYPVAVDNDFATWRRWGNRYWPTMYLVDKVGRIRAVHIGEGDDERIEHEIQYLLAEVVTPAPPAAQTP